MCKLISDLIFRELFYRRSGASIRFIRGGGETGWMFSSITLVGNSGLQDDLPLEALIHAVPESGEHRELSDTGPVGTATAGQCTVTPSFSSRMEEMPCLIAALMLTASR
jgi:hypothetical protein